MAPNHTLPASWYREKAMYELERRAVFGKSWILISHSHQFAKPGQFVKYEIAGYPFFIIKDRQGNINSFLNVCRHRAYPLIHKESGTASIIACQYHGWSYGLGGNLAKAPRFDAVEEFEKDKHSLFRLHQHIDSLGFIWVNLDGSDVPKTSWEDQFGGVDLQPRLDNFNIDDYVYEETRTFDGDFNWKTLVENYNECYHCPTAHPGLAQYISNKTKLVYGCHKNYIQHLGGGEDEIAALVSPTYMFPNASVTLTKEFFYMMSIVPLSESKTKMRFEFYRNVSVSLEEYQAAVDFYWQVEGEDKILAGNTQKNLNTNTYVAGPLHPGIEQGVTYFETILRTTLKEHAESEHANGREIWPAKRGFTSEQLDEDELFCKSVCDHTPQTVSGVMAW